MANRLPRALAAAFAGLFIVLVAAVAAPHAAHAACSCSAASTEAEYMNASDVAFDGVAAAKSENAGNFVWTFRVDNIVKDSPSNPQDVNSPKDCAMTFELGTAYRVYAKRSDSGLVTTLCSGDHVAGGPAPTAPPPTAAPTTAPRPATTAVPAGTTPASLRPVTTLPPTAETLALDTTTTISSLFTVTTSRNDVALNVENDNGGGANRVVIATIVVAALAAIGAGVVLWRRGGPY